MKRPSSLETLLGPLLFAAKNDLAGLDRIKGLERLVGSAVEAARQDPGAPLPLLEPVVTAATNIDDLLGAKKRQAFLMLLEALDACLELPESLREIVNAEPRSTSNQDFEGAGGPSETARKPVRHPTPVRAAPALPPVSTDPALSRAVGSLPGVGQGRAKTLSERGIRTVGDALWFLPVGYDCHVQRGCIADLEPGDIARVRGRVVRAGEGMLGSRRRVFDAILEDGTGTLRARHYNSGPWLSRRYTHGAELTLCGKVRLARDRVLEISHPDLVDDRRGDAAEEFPSPDSEVVPRYSEVEGVPPKLIRDIIARALDYVSSVEETIPPEIVARRGLMGPAEALLQLHRPPPGTSVELLQEHGSPAHRRLVYEELFFLQLGLALKARGVKIERGVSFPILEEDLRAACSLLPFELTFAQSRAVSEIVTDMREPVPMHRLLQGDVGSGKTAVAAVGLILAARGGFQAAVMAPTELLAEQHHRTLSLLLSAADIPVLLLSGRLRAAERRAALASLCSGEPAIVVGTQALIQDGVEFGRLGLVVVDEQHRFGVRQRASLIRKGIRPDTLVMTATPIPRTLAMTVFGDLDLTVIDELPPGRTPVTTHVFGQRDREAVWDRVREHVEKGRQAFIVYPIVETSEHLEDVRAATEMAKELQDDVFPDLRVSLLHGKMAPAEKDEVMGAFSAGEAQVLVATTVVEVGIDVPNATVMVVEHAERFGLSQLHQLRGRVGRGAKRSYCYLVAHGARGEKVRDRLKVMARTCDGFAIAEEDLRIRGPGEVLGTRQSGHPDLLFGNLARDRAVLAHARADAFDLVQSDPDLRRPEHRRAATEVLRRWGGRIQLGRVG